MGKVRIIYTTQFADNLADLIFFIESKGLVKTAQKYAERVYNFIEKLPFNKFNYKYCLDPNRADLGLKCIKFNNKYTIVFYQFEDDVIITEFIPFKLIVF